LTASDFWGNVSETNLSVVGTNFTLTVTPLDSSDVNTDVITATGTVGDASYSVWVNGVQATVDSGGNWHADNVPVNSGGTASFDVQAYAPGQSPPTNSPSAMRTNYNVDKAPYIYVSSDTQNSKYTSNTVSTCTTGIQTYKKKSVTQVQNWSDGVGGNSTVTTVESSFNGETNTAYNCTVKVDWRATLWPNLVGGSETGTGDCAGMVPTNGPAPVIGQEHCDVSAPTSVYTPPSPPFNGSTQTDETYKRTAQTTMTLFTGGKADPNRKRRCIGWPGYQHCFTASAAGQA
jgi:hypothetical protein